MADFSIIRSGLDELVVATETNSDDIDSIKAVLVSIQDSISMLGSRVAALEGSTTPEPEPEPGPVSMSFNITAPQDGSELQQGDQVTVECLVEHPSGVDYVNLEINGARVDTDPNPLAHSFSVGASDLTLRFYATANDGTAGEVFRNYIVVPAPNPDPSPPGDLPVPVGNRIFLGAFTADETNPVGWSYGPNQLLRDYSHSTHEHPVYGYVGRFEVRDGDNPLGFGERAEVQAGSIASHGDTRVIRQTMMIDPNYSTLNEGRWQVTGQLHGTYNGSPPWSTEVENGRIIAMIHGLGSSYVNKLDIADAAPGTWHEIVWRTYYHNTNGHIEVWHNGTLVAEHFGFTLPSGEGCYPKVGVYTAESKSGSRIVWYGPYEVFEAA